MKKVKIFIAILILTITNISVAQNISYFPLAVGNKWFFSQGLDNVIKLKLEIVKDTIYLMMDTLIPNLICIK